MRSNIRRIHLLVLCRSVADVNLMIHPFTEEQILLKAQVVINLPCTILRDMFLTFSRRKF